MEQYNCVFCKILEGKLTSKIITQTKNIIVIDNIAPKAPIHHLIIPKKHIPDIVSFDNNEVNLAGEMVLMAKKLAEDFVKSPAFRLIVNNGSEVGQSVFHLHFHFLAGQKYSDF